MAKNNRKRRAALAQETLQILDEGQYMNLKGEIIAINESLSASIDCSLLYYPDDFNTVLSDRNKLCKKQERFETIYEVHNETTLAGARRLVEEEKESKILCLNFASAKNPGGGFLGGSQAQEESLARSSGLYATLENHMEMYQINRKFSSSLYTDHMIYSPAVPVFRDDFDMLLDRPYLASFITAPAVNAGAVHKNESKNVKKIAPTMIARIEKLLSVAVVQGYEVLVLGAWGCGVFRNDPEEVAKYFRQILKGHKQLAGMFRKVLFSVLDRSKDEFIFEAFARQLL